MAELFAVLGSNDNRAISFAVWHSLTSERTQWEMLRRGAAAALSSKQLTQRAHGDISWTLNQLDNLGGKRNDAIHSPLVFVNDMTADTISILPMFFYGNPRALSLMAKTDLLAEFRWYRDHLSRLAHFAELLHMAMSFPGFSWPDRPKLPPFGQFQSGNAKRQRKKTK
jgi:hypothetical protein